MQTNYLPHWELEIATLPRPEDRLTLMPQETHQSAGLTSEDQLHH